MSDRAHELALAEAFARAPNGRPTRRLPVVRVRTGDAHAATDLVAAEEPLEIRLDSAPVAVTMRTPAPEEDAELAVGFLAGEAIVAVADIARVVECRAEAGEGGAVDVRLRPGTTPAPGWQRSFYATSSCGICGKASIDAVRVAVDRLPGGPLMSAGAIEALPHALRSAQRVFERTGGLHAAGLFTLAGEPVVVREDVGPPQRGRQGGWPSRA